MNLKLLNVKWVIGSFYLLLLIAGIIFLLTNYNISDFFSYEFIRLNKNIILEYRRENFLALTSLFFIFSIIWVLLLGFAMPLLIFSGFVFGKWWGVLIVLTSLTTGATLLYMLAGFFLRDVIKKDRKSTRLNSSHKPISYAVFCLKKKKKTTKELTQQMK